MHVFKKMYLKNAYFVDGLRPVLNAYLLEPVKCRCVIDMKSCNHSMLTLWGGRRGAKIAKEFWYTPIFGS